MENNSSKIKLSIIVTFIKSNQYLKKFLKNYILKNKKFFERCELILISENLFLSSYLNLENIRFLKTKFKTPGAKRNYASLHARGNYLIFLDDDSYVSDKYFDTIFKLICTSKNNNNFAYGGPGITPNDETFFGKISGYSLESQIFNPYYYRYISENRMNFRDVDDWPSMNFIVARSLFKKLKGFNEKYWPGEDSKFCEKLIKNKKKIYYISQLIVYHYRRSNFLKHFKQIYKYAYHRGIFFRQFDGNSTKIKYLIPSFFLLYLFFLLINSDNNLLSFYGPLFLFLFLNLIEIFFLIKKKIYFESFMVIFIIIINQVVYGFGFIIGLTKNSFNYKLKIAI